MNCLLTFSLPKHPSLLYDWKTEDRDRSITLNDRLLNLSPETQLFSHSLVTVTRLRLL